MGFMIVVVIPLDELHDERRFSTLDMVIAADVHVTSQASKPQKSRIFKTQEILDFHVEPRRKHTSRKSQKITRLPPDGADWRVQKSQQPNSIHQILGTTVSIDNNKP